MYINSFINLTQKDKCYCTSRIIFMILLIISVSGYQTCVAEQSYQGQSGDLIIDVISREDKHIEAYISLRAGADEAILSSYRLSVKIAPTEGRDDASGFISYTNRLGRHEQGIHIQQPLNYFTKEERMNAESEELIIPFIFNPAVGVTSAKIYYKLFNEEEILVGSATVIWEHAGIESEKQLMLSDDSDRLNVLVASIGNRCATEACGHRVAEIGQSTTETSYFNNHIKDKGRASQEESELELERGKLVIPIEYVSMGEEELARRANENDLYAQELIVTKIVTEGPLPNLLKLANTCHWHRIKEKVQQDGRYVHLLLIDPKGIKDTTIYQLFIDHVIEQAQAGDALAQTNLGIMYLTAKGVPKDSNKALKWFIRATEKNFGISYYMLGQVYNHGKKTLNNRREAITWHTKAANQGIKRSIYNLKRLYIERILIDKSEKGEELPDDKKAEYKAGIEYLARLADKAGDKDAQAALGLIYCEGKGVDQDVELGLEWINMAIDYGKNILPTNNHLVKKIGSLYYYGKFDIPINYEIAFTCYRQAAKNGLAAAQKYLSKMYFKGKGVGQNFGRATFWALQAKKEVWLVDKLKTILTNTLDPSQVKEDFESLAKSLFVSCKIMGIVEKRAPIKGNPYTLSNLFQGLEEIIVEFIEWWQQLEDQSGLLINCISLEDMDMISKYRAHTGDLTYIKEYIYQQNKYISFGESNVRFADQLLEEQVYQTHYNEALSLLEIITSIYKKAQARLIYEAKEIKKVLSKLHIDEKIKEQMLLKELNGKIRIINLFNAKLKLLEDKKKQFMSFYQLLFKQIEKRLFVRNKQFKAEHSYIFD